MKELYTASDLLKVYCCKLSVRSLYNFHEEGYVIATTYVLYLYGTVLSGATDYKPWKLCCLVSTEQNHCSQIVINGSFKRTVSSRFDLFKEWHWVVCTLTWSRIPWLFSLGLTWNLKPEIYKHQVVSIGEFKAYAKQLQKHRWKWHRVIYKFRNKLQVYCD